MRFSILLFVASCLSTSYCWSQPIITETSKPVIKKTAQRVNLIAVTFITDDTCTITIDNKNYVGFA
ncbi:MAG: hypothetical protein ABI151_06080, partial [Chitinophagaceae bacterium]